MVTKRKKATISKDAYRVLLRDVSRLQKEARSRKSQTSVSSYWAIGACIAKLQAASKAGYHNSVLRDLSTDTGVARTTLSLSVQFHRAYSRPPRDEGVRWTHYRELLRLPTKKARAFYVSKIQQDGWSSRQVNAAITAGLHEGKRAKLAAIKRPKKPAYVYEACVLDVVDGDTLDLSIDLGFGVKRELRARLAVVDAPPLKSPKGRSARDFLARELMTAKSVAVQTLKTDIYGRFVVHLFCASRKLNTLDCFEKGTHLNAALVEEKHAVIIG